MQDLAPTEPPDSQPVEEHTLGESSVPPRVWPALLIGFAAPVLGMLASGIVVAIVLIAQIGFDGPPDPDALVDQLHEFGATPLGLSIIVLPMQAMMLLGARIPAALSPEPWRHRLALRRPGLAWWTYPILILGTLAMSVVGGFLTMLLGLDDFQQVDMLYDTMASATGSEWLLMMLVVSVVPGVTEELLFRGYVQSRLLRRWSAFAAVGVTSIAFAFAHFDPVHSVAVWPVGVWLGFIAWRTESIWPSIVCHMANNSISIVMAGSVDEGTVDRVVDAPWWIIVLLAAGLLVSVILLARKTPKPLQGWITAAPDSSVNSAASIQMPSTKPPPRRKWVMILLLILLCLVAAMTAVVLYQTADYSRQVDEFQQQMAEPIARPATMPDQA